jgi:hypothetical protein
MRHPRILAAVLAAAVAALPGVEAWAQKGKKGPMPPSDKVDSSKLKAGKYAGVLKSAPNRDRAFTVEIPIGGGKNTLVEFQLTENAKVRTMLLPSDEAFDEKGNPKKYTAKELAELKGPDKSLPGYQSSIESLRAGQTVQLTLVTVPRAPDAGKKKADDGDELKAFMDKSKQVKLVVIVSSPAGAEAPRPPVKKKK